MTDTPRDTPRDAPTRRLRRRLRRLLRHLPAVALLAAVVLLTRGALITHAHNESRDDEYHLARGILFWERGLAGYIAINDPPAGAGVMALPVWLAGDEKRIEKVTAFSRGPYALYQSGLNVETVRQLISAWKALLFVPAVVGVFWVGQRLYGPAAGWLAAVAVLLEPTFAAHVPVPTPDSLGAAGILLACLALWHYANRPGLKTAAAAAAAMAFAMMLKHTAVILPGVLVLYGVATTVRAAFGGGIGWRRAVPRRLAEVGLAFCVFLLTAWAVSGFDMSPVSVRDEATGTVYEDFRDVDAFLGEAAYADWPLGGYVRSLFWARSHAYHGHWAMLFGERSLHGWWYYFPVVATYKVPVGFAVLAGLAAATLLVRRGRFDELAMALPLAAYVLFLMSTPINIGFRHTMPVMLLAAPLLGRVLAGGLPGVRAWRVAAVVCVSAGGLHALSWHPNYLSYVNFPRQRVWNDISDSNLDWGQALKQVRAWVEANPERVKQASADVDGLQGEPAPPLRLFYFGLWKTPTLQTHLGPVLATAENPAGPVGLIGTGDAIPRRGLLLASAVHVGGPYVDDARWDVLKRHDPIDTIGGGAILVYDMRAIAEAEAGARAGVGAGAGAGVGAEPGAE